LLVPQVTARAARIKQCLLTEAMVHSETANRRRDMEKRIENARLSLRELETVAGGQTVDMMGDTWESNGDGHPHRVAKGTTIGNWLRSLFK